VSWRGGDVTVAVGRVGLPEDVAKPIAFLDPRSSVRRWRTGARILRGSRRRLGVPFPRRSLRRTAANRAMRRTCLDGGVAFARRSFRRVNLGPHLGCPTKS
jgi:NAD(P)-dependent dehydrogenase (short-subunit alcohol dehydrogenase family)